MYLRCFTSSHLRQWVKWLPTYHGLSIVTIPVFIQLQNIHHLRLCIVEHHNDYYPMFRVLQKNAAVEDALLARDAILKEVWVQLMGTVLKTV